jgi:hypothetical protein
MVKYIIGQNSTIIMNDCVYNIFTVLQTSATTLLILAVLPPPSAADLFLLDAALADLGLWTPDEADLAPSAVEVFTAADADAGRALDGLVAPSALESFFFPLKPGLSSLFFLRPLCGLGLLLPVPSCSPSCSALPIFMYTFLSALMSLTSGPSLSTLDPPALNGLLSVAMILCALLGLLASALRIISCVCETAIWAEVTVRTPRFLARVTDNMMSAVWLSMRRRF